MRFQFLLAALAFVGCAREPDAPGPRPIHVPDSEICQAMCDHLGPKTSKTPTALDCEEGRPVYNADLPGEPDVPNQSCLSWCKEIQARGTYLNPRCLSKVPSCDLIEEWRKKTCKD